MPNTTLRITPIPPAPTSEGSAVRTQQKGPQSIELDEDRFEREGVLSYRSFAGFETEGVRVERHESVGSTTLGIQRHLRAGAAAGSVALNIAAAGGLLYSGIKLITGSLFGTGSTEESYESLGKAYTASSVAGTLTGLAHESPLWAIGNLFMGIFSRLGLDKLPDFAGFMVADGLSSIGMGKVRYREKGNALAVPYSIFNNPKLSALRCLIPVEQSIYSFGRRFASQKGWTGFAENEPYELFNTAGGGLVAAGGLLGIASLFKNKLSEATQSFAYLPASLFSLVNLIAFYRDGDVQVERSRMIGGKKPIETTTQRAEGNFKMVASPFLAVNNLLLALKGIGVDPRGVMYHLAMGFRAIGAASAFLGFSAQSLAKFFKPEQFGARVKEFIEIIFNPKIVARRLSELIRDLNRPESKARTRIKGLASEFQDIIPSDQHRDILSAITETEEFTALSQRSQAGLPLPGNEKTYPRFYLRRGVHSQVVCAIVIKIMEALRRHTPERLQGHLTEYELPLKIAALVHDIGHGPFSHVLDKAIPGQDNDERTLRMLGDPNSEIHRVIVAECERAGANGEEVIRKVQHILGRWDPMYQLIGGWGGDRIEYERFGDFTTVNNGSVHFQRWTMEDLERYADSFRIYNDDEGKVQVAFTPKGALQAFLLCSDRQRFDFSVNSNPETFPVDMLAGLAFGNGDHTPQAVLQMTEEEARDFMFGEIQRQRQIVCTVDHKVFTGGRNGYSYYSQVEEDPSCIHIVTPDGRIVEFLTYLDEHGTQNFLDDTGEHTITALELDNRIKAATTLQERYLRVTADTRFTNPN